MLIFRDQWRFEDFAGRANNNWLEIKRVILARFAMERAPDHTQRIEERGAMSVETGDIIQIEIRKKGLVWSIPVAYDDDILTMHVITGKEGELRVIDTAWVSEIDQD